MKRIILCFIILLSSINSWAWDNEKIHPLITEYASDLFFDAEFLKNELILDGVIKKTSFWLQEGAIREDAGTGAEFVLGIARSLNHFHSPTITNPTKNTLETSGLSDRASGESALLWTQDGNKQALKVGGNWSWKMVRDHQYNYLTSLAKADEDANLARMLMGLGYQMHMIQDMSQPNHVRNNTHILDGLGWNGFETWAKTHHNDIVRNEILDKKNIDGTPMFPIPDITVDTKAKFDETHNLAPVARLFDTRTYLGTSTPTASLSQGLSEYTNGNFFSQDTVFAAERWASNTPDKYYFPYPRQSGTDIQAYIGRTKSVYVSKTGEGERLTYLAREGASTRFWQFVFGPGKRFYGSFKFDENCYQEYAQKLIPRSVGYSKAMLDYFFRGELTASIPADMPPTSKQIRLNVRNSTPSGETMDGGSIELMVIYRKYKKDGITDAGTLVPDGEYQARKYTYRDISRNQECSSTTSGCTIGVNDTPFDFDLSSDPIPPLARDISLILVYRGKLGNEPESVAFEEILLDGVTGDLELTLPTRGVYAAVNGSDLGSQFTDFSVAARNTTGSASLPGTVELLVLYRQATGDPFQSQPVETSADIKYLSKTIPTPQGVATTPDDYLFALSSGLPVTATDVYAYIINTDQNGAVTYGYRDTSEPTPVDAFNNTDYSCIGTQWYVSGTPEARTAADQAGNKNGFDDDMDTYPHSFTDIYANVSSTASPVKASATAYDLLEAGPVATGSLKRMGYVLTDYSFQHSYLTTWVHTMAPQDGWTIDDTAKLYSGIGFTNQAGKDYSPMYTMRGQKMWGGAGVVLENTSPIIPRNCDWQAIPQ